MRLSVQNLGVNYGGIWGIRDLGFEAKAERVAVVGHNGSEKTTLLSVLSGLRKPTEGKAFINGWEPYKRNDRWVVIRYSFEKPQFAIPAKVSDLVETLETNENCPRVWELVEALGIKDFMDHRLDGLSSGQAQLCNLLAALSCDSEVLILDEPTSHLDAYRAGIIDEMLSKRKGVILATHDPEEGEAVADYFVILKDGRIVWEGDRKHLFAENVYEVTLRDINESIGNNFNILYRFGAILVVKAEREELIELMHSSKITGFKRAGLRYAYVESR